MNCPVCNRSVHKLEIHHWLPESLGGTLQETIQICGTCHDMLHYHVPLPYIQKYKTPNDIREIPELQQYLNWIKDKTYKHNWNVKYVLKKVTSS